MTALSLSSCLYVVGVPIGHIDDITTRAIKTLYLVKFIFCEDRRQTQELFKRLQITPQAKLICINEHNEDQVVQWLNKCKLEKSSAALVTDAGTPSISDPGAIAVNHARVLGIRVVPIPGVSALTTFLSIIGAPNLPVHFVGFLPKKSAPKKALLTYNPKQARLLVAFESPRRVASTITMISEIIDDEPLYIGRELTKTHEQIVIATKDICTQPLDDWLVTKGEFVLGLIQRPSLNQQLWQQAALDMHGVASINDCSQFIARYFNVNKNNVYQFLLDNKS